MTEIIILVIVWQAAILALGVFIGKAIHVGSWEPKPDERRRLNATMAHRVSHERQGARQD